MNGFLKIVFIISFFSYPIAKAQSFSTKGQFWASGLTGNDGPSGQSAIESSIGYIPTFSLSRDLSDFTFFDFEWAYRLDRSYSGDSLVSNHEKNHRLWIRYSSEKVEVSILCGDIFPAEDVSPIVVISSSCEQYKDFPFVLSYQSFEIMPCTEGVVPV